MAEEATEGRPVPTEKQAKFVEALLQGHSIPEAGRIAGYSHDSGAYQAVSSGTVQKLLREYRQRVVNTTGASRALNVMMDLLDEKTPATVRFNAARWILVAAGIGSDDEADKPLAELTEAELERLVDKLEARAKAGEPAPLISVRP